SGRPGGAVEWLDGVNLHDEVEGAPPRGGRGQQVARGVVDRGAREAAACAVDRGGGDVEGDNVKAEARDELGGGAEAAAHGPPATSAVRPVPRSERALAHCTRCGLGARLAQGIVASPRAAAW